MFRKYPGIFLLLVIIAGILLADLTRISSLLLFLFALISMIGGYVLFKKNRIQLGLIGFSLAILFFNALNFAVQFYDTGPNSLKQIVEENQRYHIFGEVSNWPLLKANRTEIPIRVDSLVGETSVSVKGDILLKVYDTTTTLQRGDKVEFFGVIYPVREIEKNIGFNYQRFLNLKGIFGVVYLPTLIDVRIGRSSSIKLLSLIDKLRAEITNVFEDNLSPMSASLASGFLIGETRNIPVDIYRYFRNTGTLHLLAVSGSNVALVILFFIFVMRPFSLKRNIRSLILMAIVFIFTFLSYGEPSVVRASVMATLVIIAGLVGRRYNLNNIIALTASIILLFDPGQFYHIGFQLSFITAWGLIFLVPIIHRKFEKYYNYKIYKYLFLPLIISLVAQVCSAPVIAFYFQKIPLVSVIANLIIVPLVSIALVGVLVLLVAALIHPLLGQFVGSLLDVLMSFIIKLLIFFNGDERMIWETGEFSVSYVILYFIITVLIVMSLYKTKIRRLTVISLLVILNIGFGYKIISPYFESESNRLIAFNLPGGMGLLHIDPVSRSSTMIVNGLYKKDYPIDEVIIRPMLIHYSIEKINNVYVLSSQYKAAEDLMNLMATHQGDTMFVNEPLLNMFYDIKQLSGNDLINEITVEPIIKLTGSANLQADRIYNFKTDSINLSFVENISECKDLRDFERGILCISSKVKMSHYDNLMSVLGYFDMVICSNIEQQIMHKIEKNSSVINKQQILKLNNLKARGFYQIDLKP